MFHDIAASVLHRRQTLCSLPSFPAINGATSADRDSPAPVVPQLPSPSPSPYLVASKTLVTLFALIRLLQFLFINCDGLRQLDPSIPGFSLRRCAGIFPFSSSSITNILLLSHLSPLCCLLPIMATCPVLLSVSFKRMPVPLRLSPFLSTLGTTPIQSYQSLPLTAPSPTFFSTRGAFLLLLKASRRFLFRFLSCFLFCLMLNITFFQDPFAAACTVPVKRTLQAPAAS